MDGRGRFLLFSPAAITPLVAVTVTAYAIHTAAWIAFQARGGAAWPRWLELTHLTALLVWVTAFGLTLVAHARARKAFDRRVLGDERTATLLLRAHQVALVVVMLAQVPFFLIAIPTPALAQLTVTTAVVVLYSAYAWLDR